ncbi:MAG TPA: aldehyde dehydrogenase family protein [Polyangia bacterium]|nr:aldehyde dehydrogenase family protein [Polyangia bacterium]
MRKGRGDYIAGRFVRARSADEFVSEDPGDTKHPVGVYYAAHAHVAAAVAAACAAGPGWAARTQDERVAALRRIREQIARRADELALTIVRETGRPLWEARQEVATMQAKVDVTVGEALAEIAERRPAGLAGRLLYRPLGVVAVVSPFNFPGHLPHGQLLPALAAGCTVVVKPSELTPAVGELYAEILDQAELPRGVFGLVQGGPAIGQALVTHADVAAVFFIGSFRTGQRIRAATSGQADKLLALEMGGKNAALVLDDADVELAAHEIARSAYITAGQRCSATTRVVATRRVFGPLERRLAELARALRVGYGLDDDVFMGPLVSARARARFLRAVRRAEKAGTAEPIVPAAPRKLARPGYYVGPSLHRVTRLDPASEYQREELFGPNLALYAVDDLEQALARANDSEYGLCMSVFTQSRAAYEDVLARGRAGVVNWNRGTVGSSPRLPFGGLGRSGNHHPAGLFAIRACVRPVATLEGAGPLPDLPGLPPLTR